MFFSRLILLLLPFLLCANEPDPIEKAIEAFLEHFQKSDSDNSPLTKTKHKISTTEGTLEYTAITGTLPQFTNAGEIVGEIFFTAYLKEGEEEDRPITFLFNGGPGGASYSMHIGGLGPRRIAFPEEGLSPLPPHQIIDNEETLLRLTDLVLIDPVSSGYSRANYEEIKPFYASVEGDLLSFQEFIRVFCIEFDRWNSPKYLLGCSYGTLRAVGLAERLMNIGCHCNGIILLSAVLDYASVFGGRDDPLSDGLLIPSLAAASWYQGRTMQDQPLEEVVEFARRFVYEQYIPAMFQSTRLSPQEQSVFYQNFSSLIGLPVDSIRKYAARIDEKVFTEEFFASDRKMLGGMDARYVGDISAIRGEYHEDPSYTDIGRAIGSTFMHYLQKELDTKMAFPTYAWFDSESFFRWNWWTYDQGFKGPSFMQRLRRILVVNPNLKVFLGSGYYDLRTPFAASEYVFDKFGLPNMYRENFQVEYYNAGHGFIFHLPSLQKMKKDLVQFYTQ